LRKRKHDDGLPHRLYMREGKRFTVFFIKNRDSTNVELSRAPTHDEAAVRSARAKAIEEFGRQLGSSTEDVAWLIGRYFSWQESIPKGADGKKATSTIDENKREADNLIAFFGKMQPDSVQPHHCYRFIDERIRASNAGVKAGKEIGLLSAVFEYGRRIGKLRDNVAKGIDKPRNPPSQVRVEWEDVELFVEVGRSAGGSYLVLALAAQFAWLTVKRSNEVRSFKTDQITDDGCIFTASKRKARQADKTGLIEWSPLLRATVDEAKRQRRWATFGGERLLFGTEGGSRYTKSGWKSIWGRLHDKAEAEALKLGRPWVRFSLQDCRPGGVTEKESRGDTDTVDATLHSDGRMVATTYDRRRIRKAKPSL
jgi:integrase